VNKPTKKPLPMWLPLLIGTLLVIQFAGLGAWQISRGLEKRATQFAYRDASGFAAWQDGMQPRSFQRLKVTGSYDSAHQIVLDNIIINSRYGHYVLTPLEIAADKPLLLVNRGWIEKSSTAFDNSRLALPGHELTVRGRAGSLPKSGYKMGDAFAAGQQWPKHAVYPSSTEVAAALGREIQPFVLLMEHDEEYGFLRHWVPSEFGPGKHFGYALQWFAMAAVLSGLLIWNYRKKRFDT
jgi:surfeit locus 1 family protein